MSNDQKEICAYCRYWAAGFKQIPASLFEKYPEFMLDQSGSCRRRAPVSYPDTPKFPPMQGGGWCAEFTDRPDDHNPNLDIRPFRHISEIMPDCMNEAVENIGKP